MLRQFHNEGFVILYYLDNISSDGKTLVFTSEAVENIPAGFKARETYQLAGDGEFTEIFELAEPGEDFTIYSKADFTRKP